MTELAEELMEGIEIGTYILVRYEFNGALNQAEGTLTRLSANFMTLETANGMSKIRLDDHLQSVDVRKGPTPTPVTSEIKPIIDPPVPQPSVVVPVVPQTVVAPTISRTMTPLPTQDPFSFNRDQWLKDVRTLLKSSSSGLKRALGGALDSLQAALKSNSMDHKYHSIRATVRNQWEENCSQPEDYRVFYLLLGGLALVARDYSYAIEPLVRAGQYQMATYAAQQGELQPHIDTLAICALLNRETTITRLTAEICIRHADGQILSALWNSLGQEGNNAELLTSCAFMLHQNLGGALTQSITPFDDARQAFDKLIQALPASCRNPSPILKKWKEYSAYTYPKPSQKEDIPETDSDNHRTGPINHFDQNNFYGFIYDNPKDCFFHVRQIDNRTDDGVLLRHLLHTNNAMGLEVDYFYCLDPVDKGWKADDVHLTEAGLEEAQRRLTGSGATQPTGFGTAPMQTGTILKVLHDHGTIKTQGKSYQFATTDIIDPYLISFYKNSFFGLQDQPVCFVPQGNYATQVMWDPKNRLERDYQLSMDYVSPEDAQLWSARFQTQTPPPPVDEQSPEDPYPGFYYVALPDYTPEASPEKKSPPLTWNEERPVPQSEPKSDKKSVFSPEKPTPSTGEEAIRQGQANVLCNQAVTARANKNFDRALSLFDQAEQYAGFQPTIITKYIDCCVEAATPAAMDKAVELLKKYEKSFPEDKFLNMAITVYDKRRDYLPLIDARQRAFSLAHTLTAKSHHLIGISSAYWSLQRYQDALEACDRWEKLYRQNSYAPDIFKLKSSQPVVQKRKAMCLYHLGQKGEATRLATDLIRQNPNDAEIMAILNDDLDSSILNPSVSASVVEDPHPEDENLTSAMTTMIQNDFVRDRIDKADISLQLKSAKLQDGHYNGDLKQAKMDMAKLTERLSGLSAKNRSDSLFSACHLLDILDQTTDFLNSVGFPHKIKDIAGHSGKAMAFWADNTIAQLDTADSARMGYLYAIQTLNISEQTWTDSYLRFLRSYFMVQRGGDSLESHIKEQSTRRAKELINYRFFEMGIPDVLLPEFLVGIFRLYLALGKNSGHQTDLIQALYTTNPELRQGLIPCMGQLCQAEYDPTNCSEKAFRTIFAKALANWQEKIRQLNSLLQQVANVAVQNPISSDQMQQLSPEVWKPYLCATESKFFNTIFRMLVGLQDYFGQSFDTREESLRNTLLQVENLIRSIQETPTDFAYSSFLPRMRQIAGNLASAQELLYQNLHPSIRISQGLQAYWLPNVDNWLQIELMVENEACRQTAEDLYAEVASGAMIEDGSHLDCNHIPQLRGGEDSNLTIRVKVSKQALNAGSFDMEIGYCYSCRSEAISGLSRHRNSTSVTVVIHDGSIVPLNNPYNQISGGNPVQNENMFYGRQTQIDGIIDSIMAGGTPNYGKGIAVYGQTRTGKSSLLYHLKNRLTDTYPDQVIVWELPSLPEIGVGDHNTFQANFLYAMMDNGQDSLLDHPIIGPIWEDTEIEPDLSTLLDHPESASLLFGSYMREVTKVLKEHGCIVALFIDEFTYLHGLMKQGRLSMDFMKFWKSMLQNYCFCAVVAGQDDMLEFMQETYLQNDWGVMDPLKLTYLDEPSARQLIREPLKRDNADQYGPFTDNDPGIFADELTIEKIYELTAGSAFLINVLCYHLVEYVNQKGAYKISDALYESFLRERVFSSVSVFIESTHFESHLQERGHMDLTDENKQILLAIARKSRMDGFCRLQDISCPGISPVRVADLVQRLVNRDVLDQVGTDKYSIRVKLLERWLIRTEEV